MRLSNPHSLYLGTYTFAGLQSAYPNGSAALAALPAGTLAMVSDWGALFTPSSDGARWNNVSNIVLGRLASPVTVNSGTAAVAVFSCSVPANLMGPTSGLRWRHGVKAAANATSITIASMFDSTQIDGNSCSPSAANTGFCELWNHGVGSNDYTYNTGYSTTGLTLATHNAWTFSVTLTPNNSGDSATLRNAYLELL